MSKMLMVYERAPIRWRGTGARRGTAEGREKGRKWELKDAGIWELKDAGIWE